MAYRPETWRFNPARGLFQSVDQAGRVSEASYSELSGEAYELTAGGQLQPTAGGPLYQQGSAGDIIYLRYANGYGELQSQLAGRPRNLYTTEDATYGFGGTLNLTLPSGQTRSIDIAMADLYGRGNHLYTYTGDTGQREYIPLAPGSDQYFAAQAAAPVDFREATTDEAIEYGLRGYLAKNAQDLLTEWAGPAGQGMAPAARQARYDAARAIAQLSMGPITLYKTHVVGFTR